MNSSKKVLYTVPVASTAFESGGAYMLLGTIRYNFDRDGVNRRSGIRFKRIKATRTYSESASNAWHIEGAYDTLVEIENSPWVEELQGNTADRQRRIGETWEMHHYMIYLDSSGTFEVIAESWEALPEEAGSWPNPMTI
ncbi:MAG TPA: hypothetical protein VIM11_16275 [Tepidisphaeraceae bacterium]|jgi:hypothetical protein